VVERCQIKYHIPSLVKYKFEICKNNKIDAGLCGHSVLCGGMSLSQSDVKWV